MKAKFIYEAIGDILKGKSDEEIEIHSPGYIELYKFHQMLLDEKDRYDKMKDKITTHLHYES